MSDQDLWAVWSEVDDAWITVYLEISMVPVYYHHRLAQRIASRYARRHPDRRTALVRMRKKK